MNSSDESKKKGGSRGTHPTLNDGIARPAVLLLR
jgi:hypothetical protein